MPKYTVGQKLSFNQQEAVVKKVAEGKYYCEVGSLRLSMWVPERMLRNTPAVGMPVINFNQRSPHLLCVDNFYQNPDEIRAFALEQDFVANEKVYKGKRTTERFLWPFLKEEFERILGKQITDWTNQLANGCFQITGYDDPLVWHSDRQNYAAAIYLTPDAPIGAGTSFWRDKKYHSRRPPVHPLESWRFPDDKTRMTAYDEIYTSYNILNPDNWELVDRIGAVYNRLVMWDGQMIHSASSYSGLERDVAGKARLVQLFFFNVK